jgi:phosphate starvation-inducible PhoH-like protein
MSKRSRRETGRETVEVDSKKSSKSGILYPISPKTAGQEQLLDAIAQNEVVICDGPSGSGKTFLAFGSALKYYFESKNIYRIIIVRPTIAAGDDSDLGYLPGTLNYKMLPFLAPIVRDSAPLLLKSEVFRTNMSFNDRGSPDPLAALLTKIDIEVVPLAFIRGRTFHNSFIILDEAQNCTLNDFKLFLTRVGRNSKVVIEGDSTQCDIDDSGLKELQTRMTALDSIAVVTLDKSDIIRNPLIARILDRL